MKKHHAGRNLLQCFYVGLVHNIKIAFDVNF